MILFIPLSKVNLIAKCGRYVTLQLGYPKDLTGAGKCFNYSQCVQTGIVQFSSKTSILDLHFEFTYNLQYPFNFPNPA